MVTAPAQAQVPDLLVQPVALNPTDLQQTRVGQLEYLGGLALSSEDARFGGWSGGVGNGDLSEVTLVGDRGMVLVLALERDRRSGLLDDAEPRAFFPLRDTAGRPLSGKSRTDAEALARLADGAFAVGFERDHRILRYEQGIDGPAAGDIAPKALSALPAWRANGGVEALAASHDGVLVAILEGPSPLGQTPAFIDWGEGWQERSYLLPNAYGATDAGFLPGGDLLVLERFYSPAVGAKARVRRIPTEVLDGVGPLTGPLLAEFSRPLTVDNFEILLTGRDRDGSSLILLGSDDNFSRRQRSLLMLFRLIES